MKKNLLVLFSLCITYCSSFGQVSKGGIPLSIKNKMEISEVTPASYLLPDWEAELKEDSRTEDLGISKPYLVGSFTEADFRFPESGIFSVLEDGQIIWSAQIYISQAPAIGLYYDEFHLPKGVELYLFNKKGNQILGGYTAKNNSREDDLFANEAIEGEVVNLELNINPEVDYKEIRLHVNRALVYFRGIEHLKSFSDEDITVLPVGSPDPYQLEGGSSYCMINAICPEGDGYEEQRKSTVQLLFVYNGGAGLCSGTLVNNTENTADNCNNYLLTASHCESTGSGKRYRLFSAFGTFQF